MLTVKCETFTALFWMFALVIYFGLEIVVCLEIRVLTYTTPSPILLAGLPYSGPPIAIAQEEVVKEYGLNITNVIIAHKGLVTCDEAVENTYRVPKFVYESWDVGRPFFIVNPGKKWTDVGCYDELTLGDYAREWNVPTMSTGTTYPLSYNMEVFPTMVSFAAFDLQQLTDGILDICELYSWTNVAVIHDVSKVSTLYIGVYESLMANTARISNFTPMPVDSSVPGPITFDSILDRIWPVSRIVLLLMMAKPARDFLIAAQKAGRTNGEYVYFLAEPFEGARRFGNLTWQFYDQDDSIARDAFRSVIQLTANCFSMGKHPLQAVMDRIKSDGIAQYNASYVKNEETSAASLGHYYGFKALGQVLHEAIRDDADLRDGRAMTERFRNRTFLFHNSTLIIGPGGVRIQDYCLRDMNVETGAFQPTISYNSWTRQLVPIDNREMDWASVGNVRPKNEPLCGFTGEKPICRHRSVWFIRQALGGAIPVAIILLLIFSVLLRRQYQAANGMQWWTLEARGIGTAPQKHSRLIGMGGVRLVH